MKNERLEQILVDIGLTPNEARLYLTMLASGPSPILKLARLSGLKRTTLYAVIERLEKLGIARVDISKLKRLFVAEAPDKLEAALVTRKELLERHLSEFEALARPSGRSSFLKYYEGIPAIEGVYEEILEHAQGGDEYLAISDEAQWEAADKNFFPRYQERRAKTPLHVRLILQDSEAARRTYNIQRAIGAQVRLLPSDTKLTTNLVIAPGRVVIHQLSSPPLAIVIENDSVIGMHREMFEIIWHSLPENSE